MQLLTSFMEGMNIDENTIGHVFAKGAKILSEKEKDSSAEELRRLATKVIVYGMGQHLTDLDDAVYDKIIQDSMIEDVSDDEEDAEKAAHESLFKRAVSSSFDKVANIKANTEADAIAQPVTIENRTASNELQDILSKYELDLKRHKSKVYLLKLSPEVLKSLVRDLAEKDEDFEDTYVKVDGILKYGKKGNPTKRDLVDGLDRFMKNLK